MAAPPPELRLGARRRPAIIEGMADLYEPYEKLIPIEVLGKRFEVPENNILLRQLQFVAPDVGTGGYCWNAECRYCEIKYEVEGRTMTGLACRVKAMPNFKVTKLAPELKYNISEALRNAPPVEPDKA
ncbi:MAG: hypothetical protein K1Y01_12545 [Vicinamibacteria bacterium]|nr:hypothetical protein [Vicinamibacteria bacterium]